MELREGERVRRLAKKGNRDVVWEVQKVEENQVRLYCPETKKRTIVEKRLIRKVWEKIS